MKTLVILSVVLFCVYGVAVLSLYINQEKLLFPAEPLPAQHQFAFDVPFQEVSIPVEGATLNALHFQQENPHGVVFFLHGNAGNLRTWTTNVDFYQQINYDLFIFDYRGYGKSTGTIESEQQLLADVEAAWAFIAPRYTNKKQVVYGRSLGSGLAIQLAAKVNPDLLVLVSPFSSMGNVAKLHYPWAPGWILRYPLLSNHVIADVTSPTLFIHGGKDTLIPHTQSDDLAALMTAQHEVIVLPEAGHGDINAFPEYWEVLTQALIDLGNTQ